MDERTTNFSLNAFKGTVLVQHDLKIRGSYDWFPYGTCSPHKIWGFGKFWIIYMMTNWIADNFYAIHIQGWLRRWCHVLSISRFWKIILHATFLRVWCMWYTILLMLKEFFQTFAWYIRDFFMMNRYSLLLSLCVSIWKPLWRIFL